MKKFAFTLLFLIVLSFPQCTIWDNIEEDDVVISFSADGTERNYVTAGGVLNDQTAIGGTMILTINGNDAVSGDYESQIFINFISNDGLTEKVYDMQEDEETAIMMTYTEVFGPLNVAQWASYDSVGTIKITELDLENETLSGTFSATLQFDPNTSTSSDQGEMVIANGKFIDLPL